MPPPRATPRTSSNTRARGAASGSMRRGGRTRAPYRGTARGSLNDAVVVVGRSAAARFSWRRRASPASHPRSKLGEEARRAPPGAGRAPPPSRPTEARSIRPSGASRWSPASCSRSTEPSSWRSHHRRRRRHGRRPTCQRTSTCGSWSLPHSSSPTSATRSSHFTCTSRHVTWLSSVP